MVVPSIPGPWEKRAGLFPGHLLLMLLFEAHEFCTLIGLDWVTGPLLESGMETGLLKSMDIRWIVGTWFPRRKFDCYFQKMSERPLPRHYYHPFFIGKRTDV